MAPTADKVSVAPNSSTAPPVTSGGLTYDQLFNSDRGQAKQSACQAPAARCECKAAGGLLRLSYLATHTQAISTAIGRGRSRSRR